MATLLLRLQGPMQSWGTASRFDERDTQLEPSKSGVIGLLCAALGRDRAQKVDDLAVLRMGVRVDQEGTLLRDFQTAKGVFLASGKSDLQRTVVSPRYFLSDAAFLVGLEGADTDLLQRLHSALRQPIWPLSLGRKSFVPGMPVYLPDGLSEKQLQAALQSWPPLSNRPTANRSSVRYLLEDSEIGSMRLDQPISSFSERIFGPRFVKTVMLELGDVNVSDTDLT